MGSQLQAEDDILVGDSLEQKKAESSNGLVNIVDCIRLLRLRPSGSVIACAAPPICPQIPISEIAPRRKVVWVWICCVCGYGGMKVSVDPCPNCCNPRCPNCDTRRINTRS
ncbi:hypothetical protein FPOA_01064 [Fusarium poae]|uniref:Uncharacterized protein n=1 Tax=Fusarium poae TaxID=36050 RepID=A0A1B8B330_FUSPO|nr:hypothetical protein FPOA_01064 [Fusarium poae]